ncbi:MAG TPA: hypothetical protein VE988_07765, partial [Gemmataceae bacterium]|nr:hypothetical protein [Gemmataceae bacterium]
RLADQLRAKGIAGVPAKGQAADVSKEDYKTLLNMSRSALQRGDLDLAESYCKQAEKKDNILPNMPWNDSPTKVMRDIQTARQKQAVAMNASDQMRPVQDAKQDSKQEQPSMLTSGLNKVKSMFTPNAPQPEPKNDVQQPKQMRPVQNDSGIVQAGYNTPDANPMNPNNNMVAGPAVTPQMPPMQQQNMVSKETLEARMLRDKAIEAITRDDLVAAKKYAEQAKAKMDPNSWWERPSPDELLVSINQHLGNGAPGAGNNGKGLPAANGALPPVDAANARNRLKEARVLFSKGQLDDAERLCGQVATVKVSWGVFEDNPDKLRSDLKSARQKSDKAESVKVLTDARKALASGNLDEARAKAWKAKQMHGPYNMWDLGDRPDKLLADIDTAEAKLKKTGNTVVVAKDNLNKGNNKPNDLKSGGDNLPPPVSVAAMSAKQRAQGLLAEGRLMLQQGNLAGAQAKGFEARNAANEAYKAGLGFGPGEESPDMFLLALSGQAKARIDGLVRSADEIAADPTNDAARLKKASDCLYEAHNIALQFKLDTMPLEGRLKVVAQRQGNPGGLVNVAAQQSVQGNMGLKLLDDSRKEIAASRLTMARKLAEEAFDPKYGVQDQAAMVLRSIDIEVFEQQRREADRAFIAANDAFLQKDYRRAQGILAEIDDRLLSDRNKGRLREIAMQPEMQLRPVSGEIKQIQGNPINVQGPGTANVSDMPMPGVKPGTDDFASYNAIAAVQRDMFLKEGLNAQRLAMQKAKDGDLDAAIEVLRGYTASLQGSGLDAEQVAVLAKSPERKVQEYLTIKAQQKFQKEQLVGQGGAVKSEQQRQMKQFENDKEISKLADQAGQLMRDGKFIEARLCWLKIQDIDPENPAAKVGLPECNIQAQIRRNAQIDINKKTLFQYELEGDPGPYVDMVSPVSIDPKRFEKNKDRPNYMNGIKMNLKDPADRALQRELNERKVTLAFSNLPLQTCIDGVRQYVGNLNILCDHAAIQTAGIHLDKPVSLTVTDMSLKDALTHLLKNANLTFCVQNQAIVITTEEGAAGRHEMRIYPVTDLIIPIPNNKSQQIELDKARWQAAINKQLNAGGGYGAPSAYSGAGALPPGQQVSSGTGAFAGQPNNLLGPQPPKPTGQQTMEELLIRLITSTIAPNTWSDVGGKGTIQYYPIGNALVVNQTQDIQEQIIDLLQALRRLQDLEVAIEMRLVSVSEAFFEFMGVNFDMNILHGSTRYAPELLSGNFAPAGQINQFAPSSFWSGLTPAGTFTPDLGVPIKPSSFGFSLPPFGGYPGTLGADGGISLGLAFLSDVQVHMFLEAAQGDRRTNVMQAPKITVFNGQTANINVGDELTFLDTIDVIQVNSQTVFQPAQNRTAYGVFMTVTPVVSADRRFVRLNLNPTLRNLISATVPLLPVQQVVPQLFYDGISPPQPAIFQMFFQQPSTAFITLDTTVVVPDGGTVLMGGLKTMVEGRNEFGPPVLGKIPYLDRLFRNVGYGREAQSLMIMVTARIIINEEEEMEFRGELQPRIPR